jgi:hypothetical protein
MAIVDSDLDGRNQSGLCEPNLFVAHRKRATAEATFSAMQGKYKVCNFANQLM